MFTTKIIAIKPLTHNISLYQNNTTSGNVVFNIKNNKVTIETIYLMDKFRFNNTFINYWDQIEEHIITSYKINYANSKQLIIEINAKELDTKYNKLINKYMLLGFEQCKKERSKYVDEILYRIVPMKKIILLN